MAWSYTTGVLTSTGATEASPDSLLAGIAIVQAADATRGYRNGFVGWLNNVQIIYVNSFVIIDDDATIELRGTAYFASGGAVGLIFGNRSTLIVATSSTPGVGLTTGNVGFPTGSTIITRRQNPNDPSPKIIYRNTARHDFPSVPNNAQVLAKVAIAGLDLYDVNLSAFNFFRLFFANATSSSVKAIRSFVTSSGGTIFPNGNNIFLRAGTYEDLYQERVSVGTELNDNNTTVLLRPTYYSTTPQTLSGLIRDGMFVLTNPSFLNNCWNGAVFFQYSNFDPSVGGAPGAASKLTTQYTMQQTFRQGLTALSGVRVRYTRARQSVTGAAAWTAPGSVVTATSDASGSFAAVSLVDAYREGTAQTDIERFNWTAKARRYDRRTAGEAIFANRVLYQHSVNMSAGYSEEVQMLAVPYLTLTEVQAAALTGITLSASGATGGTVTISGNRTASDLWHYYRQWIAQTANFDSNDTWTFDGTTLNMGAWNVVVNAGVTLTGNLTTTGTVTLANGATINGIYTSLAGTSAQIQLLDLTAGSSIVVLSNSGTVVDYVASSGTSYTWNIAPGQAGNWTWKVTRYGFNAVSGAFTPGTGGVSTARPVLLPDAGITEVSVATVGAYTALGTLDRLYDYSAWWETTQAGIVLSRVAVRSGTAIDLGTHNIAVDANVAIPVWAISGNTLTVKASALVAGSKFSTFTTTGVASTLSGATIGVSYTDAAGTRITIRTADNLPLSTYLTIDGVPQPWQAGQTARNIFVGPTTQVRIYAHAYGYQPRIFNIVGNTASDYVLNFTPETVVNTGLSTSIRDTIAAQFATGVDTNQRIFLSVAQDLRAYRPDEVLNALHWFIVTQGATIAAAATAANSVDAFALIEGGFVIRSPGFYGKVADSVTTVGNAGIYVPLYVDVDPSVYVAMPTYTPTEKNASDILLAYALWSQQTVVISALDKADIRNGLATHSELQTINEGVQKASLLVPHTGGL